MLHPSDVSDVRPPTPTLGRPRRRRGSPALALLATLAATAGCGSEPEDPGHELVAAVAALERHDATFALQGRLEFATSMERRLELLERVREQAVARGHAPPDEAERLEEVGDEIAASVLDLRLGAEEEAAEHGGEDSAWRAERERLLQRARVLERETLALAGFDTELDRPSPPDEPPAAAGRRSGADS